MADSVTQLGYTTGGILLVTRPPLFFFVSCPTAAAGSGARSRLRMPANHMETSNIARMLISIGIPVHLKGHQYLLDLVDFYIDSPRNLHPIEKYYSRVAYKHKVTPTSVRSAVEHSIMLAQTGERNAYKRFTYKMAVQGRPLDAETFVALLGRFLLMEMEIMEM